MTTQILINIRIPHWPLWLAIDRIIWIDRRRTAGLLHLIDAEIPIFSTEQQIMGQSTSSHSTFELIIGLKGVDGSVVLEVDARDIRIAGRGLWEKIIAICIEAMFFDMRIAVANILTNGPVIVELVFELVTDLGLLSLIIVQIWLSEVGLARNLAKFGRNDCAKVREEAATIMCQVEVRIIGKNGQTCRFIRLIFNAR
ncbi:hypothetical protein D3C80_536590 [compost metagenome]